MIGDILFTLAAIGFTYSAIPQILKLRRVKNSVGISYKRHKILFVCIVVTIVACIYTKLWLSTAMNSFQLICVIILMYQIKKYRKKLPKKLIGDNAGMDRPFYHPTNKVIGYNAGVDAKRRP